MKNIIMKNKDIKKASNREVRRIKTKRKTNFKQVSLYNV